MSTKPLIRYRIEFETRRYERPGPQLCTKGVLVGIAGKREEAEKAIERGLELSTVADNRFYITLLYTYLVLGEYDKAGSVSKNQLADYYPFDAAIRDYSNAGKGECEAMTKDAQASRRPGWWSRG